MSAKGLFTRGFTEGEVKQIQATAKKMLLEGKTLMSWKNVPMLSAISRNRLRLPAHLTIMLPSAMLHGVSPINPHLLV